MEHLSPELKLYRNSTMAVLRKTGMVPVRLFDCTCRICTPQSLRYLAVVTSHGALCRCLLQCKLMRMHLPRKSFEVIKAKHEALSKASNSLGQIIAPHKDADLHIVTDEWQ